MGGRRANYLVQTHGPRVGPTPSASPGVRPFVINHAFTRAYITWTDFRGFSVGNLRTGRIIASRSFGRVPAGFRPSAPSHGITLSPGGRRVYVLDAPNRQVRVYTAQGRLTMALLMGMPPIIVATMLLLNPSFIRPLFSDPIGHFLLVAGITLQTVGYFVIRKIIRIQV